jgi:NTP pyrophosphatase (non-canonical NTP hydrolase)
MLVPVKEEKTTYLMCNNCGKKTKISKSTDYKIVRLIHPVIEELGEFSKELQIRVGLHRNKKSSNKKLQEEFGDLLFAVLALGKGLKINVEEAILQTIEKYHKRDG